jgi:hypothetical protein
MHQKGSVVVAALILLMLSGAVVYYGFGSKLFPKMSSASSTQLTTSTGLLPKLPSVDEVFLSSVDKCEALVDEKFISLEKREVGRGVTGPVIGYWSIQFKEGKHFSWHHSDVGENGTYTCSGNVIKATFFDHSLTAFYDPGKDILTWDGLKYVPSSQQ